MSQEKPQEAEMQGHPEATMHAARVSVLDALRYASVIAAVVEAFKIGGLVSIPTITSWTPYGKRYIKIVTSDRPIED